MSLLQNSNAIQTAGGYDINNSLRLRNSASAYLSRTPASAGNRKTWTYSAWVKRSNIGANGSIISAGTGGGDRTTFGFITANTIQMNYLVGGNTVFAVVTNALFRDPSAWYHIVVAFDTTQATAANRVKVYVNGVQQTYSSATYPNLNLDGFINNTVTNSIGWNISTGGGVPASYLDGYITEANFIDGQALTPSSFGETDTDTGVWKPKAYTGTYGTNGFYLKFSDIATTSGSNAGLGKDFSGNANYFTTNNISVTAGTTYDAMIDSPTLTSATVANYAIFNPVATTSAGAVVDGNLKTNAADKRWYSSIGVSSGKWYFEYTIVSTNLAVGIGNDLNAQGTNLAGRLGYQNTGDKVNGTTTTAYGASYTANDVIGVALDMDAGTLVFYKNNVSQGTAFTGITGTYYASCNTGASGATWINFGQRPFVYTPPTGFLRLNTFNLPDSTIVKGNSYMDATTYTGTGANQTISTNNIDLSTNGLAWIKARSAAEDNYLFDSLRALTGTKYYLELNSNTTDADSNFGGITSPTLGSYTNTAGAAPTNINGRTYVQWLWQAGSAAAASNTAGSITSTVSANPTAGFSIVTYTGNSTSGATIGHGLGVAPKMIFVKTRNAADNWAVYHSTTGATQYLQLNNTNASASSITLWNNTSPTSTVFSVGTNNDVNYSARTYVAYCWAEIAGFSAFGSYTGNGSADGPFVFTGFRPKFLMVKRTNTTSNWTILDTAREGYNVDNDPLFPNLNNAEGTTDLADILSNGFKLRSTDASVNASAGTYIYMAFAENPFKNSLAR